MIVFLNLDRLIPPYLDKMLAQLCLVSYCDLYHVLLVSYHLHAKIDGLNFVVSRRPSNPFS